MGGGGGWGEVDARANFEKLAILDNLRYIFLITGLFLKFIWQFGDVVEFLLWDLMLPWQQHFEGHG